MTLQELRDLYVKASDEDKPKITLVGKAVKDNPNYGSVEVGGNGFCYTCFLEPARKDHWNCENCAGKKTTVGIKHTVEYMMEKTKQMSTPQRWEDMAKDVFNA